MTVKADAVEQVGFRLLVAGVASQVHPLSLPRMKEALHRGVVPPGSRLSPEQKAFLEYEYGMQEGQLRVPSLRGTGTIYVAALPDRPVQIQPKASAQQIVVVNLEELRPWLYS